MSHRALRITVPENRIVQLPADVPTGEIEILIADDDGPTAEEVAERVARFRALRARMPKYSGDSVEQIKQERGEE